MEVKAERITDWTLVLNAARMTVHKGEVTKEPSDQFKRSIVMSEHSPLRMLTYKITCKDVPYYVSVHIVRHHEGIEKFVATQRDDRVVNTTPRGKKPQDSPVDMMLIVNAQALINISKLRLCGMASPVTRTLWRMVREAISQIDPVVSEAMVPSCIYRGFCPEPSPCGFCNTEAYKHDLEQYRNNK